MRSFKFYEWKISALSSANFSFRLLVVILWMKLMEFIILLRECFGTILDLIWDLEPLLLPCSYG